MRELFKSHRGLVTYFLFMLLVPLFDVGFGSRFHDLFRPILILSVLGLALNVVVGLTGLLHLGIAGFMAVGAFSYAIMTCDIYPFQLPFIPATFLAMFIGGSFGFLLGLPTVRLRGDYLAIVTLGFGEIVQDSLRNLEVITKGTQGINPIPAPSFFGVPFTQETPLRWYFLFLAILFIAVVLTKRLEKSRFGRSLEAIREDELAAQAMGVQHTNRKLLALSFGGALAALAGALWVLHLGSSGEPGNYDFQMSILALCIVIVGGTGSTLGVLIGALVMVGFNSVVLVSLNSFLTEQGLVSTGNVISSPNNWKYFLFGLALIVMMRVRPEGLIPARRSK